MENQIDQLLKMKDLINKIQIDYNNQVDELKTVTERLEKYKALLKFRNIPFEADIWTWNNDDL